MPRGLDLESVFDAVLFCVGAVIVYVSWGYGFGSLEQPGPGLYPFFVGATIVACSLVLLVARLRSGEKAALPDRRAARTLVLMTLTFCLWILAMPLLGYVLVTFIAAHAFCKAVALEGWRKPLALSAGTAAFIYLVFGYWLYIDLPRGIFFE